MIVNSNRNSTILTGAITDWITNTSYANGNYIQINSIIYKCVSNHTSGVFNTDLNSGYWFRMDDPTQIAIAMTIALG
jgi:hypothetical protein